MKSLGGERLRFLVLVVGLGGWSWRSEKGRENDSMWLHRWHPPSKP